MKRENLILTAISILFFLTFFSCSSKDNPTEPEKQSEPPITDIAGSWSGTTSQNKPLAFGVLSESDRVNRVTYFKITIRFSSSEVIKEVSGLNSYVTKDKHDFLVALPGDPFIAVDGIFTSNSKCNGTFSSGSIEGTWTATKK